MRMPHPVRSLCASACLLVVAALVPAAASPAHYALDPVHTRVMFAIDHAGFSKAIGTVSGTTGTLVFDPDDWTLARVEASIPVGRIDLGDEAWNRATRARGLLDAERHPVAAFISTHVEPVDAHSARVHGRLTLRGVTRDVVLDTVLNGLKRHPLPPFRRTVGFSATAMLSRADYGIDAWRSMIGDAVELRFEVEATRVRGSDAPDDPATDADDAETGLDDGDVDPPQSGSPSSSVPPASSQEDIP